MATFNGTFLPDVIIGTSDNDIINGFGGADILTGGDGDDLIDGGEGEDVLSGGEGNDTLIGGPGFASLLSLYFGGAGNDVMIASTGALLEDFDGGDGIDTVSFALREQGVTVDLGMAGLPVAFDNVRNTENVIGSAFSDSISGDANANRIDGGGGDDIIAGAGGSDVLIGDAGTDEMRGGSGDDAYLIDVAGDQVIELAGEGYDTAYTLVSFDLAIGQAVEVLTVYDRDTTHAINLGGNDFANILYGNDGANLLSGGGAVDTAYGLDGDDRYIVEQLTDIVLEADGEGYDSVYALNNYVLTAGQEIEVLSVYDRATSYTVDLTGNDRDNLVYGNDGRNLLTGGGGADTLYGLDGNDSFIVEDTADLVIEFADEGHDTVYTFVDYALMTGESVETLTVYDRATSNALDLTGNNLDNAVYGNAGANRLDGKGGNDMLFGLGGADVFLFTTGPSADNVDQIFGFEAESDRIELDDMAFVGLGTGPLSAGAFVAGGEAQDADDRILYDHLTGNLYFDADGSGAGQAVLFARLDGHPPLAASDFSVI